MPRRRAASGCAPTTTASVPASTARIRDLIERGRLNATSVMVVGPAIGRDEVSALKSLAASQSALRHRPACHADGAVSALDDALQADRRRHVPAISETAARRPDAQARSRSHPHRIDGATFGLRRIVRPSPGLCRRSPACAAISGRARCLSGGGERCCAQRLGSPGRAQSTLGPAARHAQGIGSRRLERAVPPPRRRAPISRSTRHSPVPTIFPDNPISGR